MIRYLRLISRTLILIGAGLVIYSLTLPIYTDPSAPAHLSQKLAHGQIQEWYAQLAQFETPHKRLFNWGQGLIGLGISLVVSIWVVALYLRNERFRNAESFFIGWNVLWLLHFPATIYFFWLRQSWFEFPTWSDAIGIPIMREFTAWIVGAVVTSLLLFPFFYRRDLPTQIRYVRPETWSARIRLGCLVLWEAVLILCALLAVPDGDLGMIVSCTLGAAMLLILLSAEPKQSRSN